ncbi:succinate dehydrogenase/fumarate reductase flavoprotein subunit [Aliiruegeria haliotis]|uniref:Succinate dehydrogenase/fumarate reductase flavoprotein subunit n=1 Tax=Aliiruegeria haliotis TaxID=1280846 RepID=A0A2T0RFH1_9RHOB|nr:FAD-binding protein [Aliiruegeria haliotis]PRY19918.1 succinate dehydrogenase/fumarate reductase flavoprotein subunit [Aliiruegeria haliotis]
MTINVPQDILDALTDVKMPKLAPEPPSDAVVEAGAVKIPVFRADCVVVGSGAAGLRAAVEMKRRDVDVTIISQSAWGGTSACSGSDKQTLHTANTADQGDNFLAMAESLRAGGAMDEDTAYIEAVGSQRAMGSLQFMGLPLPQAETGAILRYQTDHDEVGRATSCGPRTSRLMVKVLAEEALRLEVPFYNQTTAIRILTDGEGKGRKVCGILTIRARERSETNPFGLAVFQCPLIVLAAGGPGELYRDSVFPNGCFGSLGLALEAGVDLVNITESQFGIGTRREGFPWNLSGTYVQTMPYIYSVDVEGKEHNFLAKYYRTTQELASNVFRKGYQWPFHATRMLDFGSSLVDLAIHRETSAGRTVYMNFNRNPEPVDGDLPFSLDRLDEDVTHYLRRAGANQDMPIDRLRHMNPLAIELYRRYKIDIAVEPLEFAVNNQHMNGGVAVDIWGRSSLPGCYAVGEAAGTHGVTRPGGSALNAGQVFGTRVAEHIAGSAEATRGAEPAFEAPLRDAVDWLNGFLRTEGAPDPDIVRESVQARMSDKAGILCTPGDVAEALAEAQALNAEIRGAGMAYHRAAEVPRAIQWQQMALASEAVLAALDHFIRNGGGSRGARAICDPDGECLPDTPQGVLEQYRFRRERESHKSNQIHVRLDGEEIRISERENRRFDPSQKPAFERDWPDWLTGQIYEKGPAGND